ncbi:hypothetical protein C8Q79DRAFT_885001, partial [Trametes meyenii]
IVKIVNALSAASEIGGPAVCSYLLGNPDHYTNETFKVFYWYAYVTCARDTCSPILASNQSPDYSEVSSESVLLGLTEDGVVALNKVNDYLYHPTAFTEYSLYDYLRCTDVRKLGGSDSFVKDPLLTLPSNTRSSGKASAFPFLPGHPLEKTHGVFYRRFPYTLNFVGHTLPRRDKGDRDEYCSAMLAFFRPWRNGRDLISSAPSWSAAFDLYAFIDDHECVMRNMNLMYKCLDARDDYSA